MSRSEQQHPPFERLGPYRIQLELGRGGMGTVYQGVHVGTGEPAAVKLLAAGLARQEGFRDRFEGEIETLRKLRHPNIVRLFGFGEQDGALFYAMELVEGSSLEEELTRGRRFDWREVTEFGIQVCRALRHAHDRGVIHRDIKPGNLLLGSDDQIKLSDFGIARLFGNTRLTNVGSVLGTAEYMSPEQAGGRPVGPRSDLYSLGAVFYALLTGRPMFLSKSLPKVLQKQQYERPEPISSLAPEVPAGMEKIVEQLLEKDPERRPANPTILMRQLESMRYALTLRTETVIDGAPLDGSSRLTSPATDAINKTQAADQPASASDEQTTPPPAMAEDASDEAFDVESPPSAEELPDTKPTATFKDVEADEPPPPTGKAESRFTAIPEEELDRDDRQRSSHTLITLQTTALAVTLALFGWGVWYFLQPPAADDLHAEIARQTADGTIESLRRAEDDIHDFLTRFPDDPRCDQLRDFERRIELDRLEKLFDRRARGFEGSDDLAPVEQAYLEAIRESRLDPDLSIAKLQALIDLYGDAVRSPGPVGDCLELARRRLEQLQQQRAEQIAEHLTRLNDRLDKAAALADDDPERARAIYQGAVELYADKPWAAEVVARARQSLKEIPSP